MSVFPTTGYRLPPALVAVVLALGAGAGACFAEGTQPSTAAESDNPLVYHTWRTFTTQDGLPNDSILALRVAGHQVWVGTDKGLALYDGELWQSWTEHRGQPLPAISAIDLDPITGDVWLGTWGGGLIRFSGGRFDAFTQFNSGLAGDLVFDVAVNSTRVYIATNGGISAFDPVKKRWDLQLERRADGPETAIVDFTWGARPLKVLIAAAWCGPLYRLDSPSDRWTMLNPKPMRNLADDADLMLDPSPTTVAVSFANQKLWWATRTQLIRHDARGRWESRRVPGDVPLDAKVTCMAVGAEDSEVLLGTDAGLLALADWERGVWTAYQSCASGSTGLVTLHRPEGIVDTLIQKSAIPTNQIRCVALGNREVWVGTARGLARGSERRRWDTLRGTSRKGTSLPAPSCETPDSMGVGQGRFGLDPKNANGVTIAVFGPITKSITLPGDDLKQPAKSARPNTLAIQLAVNDANALGGYRQQVPFALEMGTHGYPWYGWGQPEDEIVRFVRRPVVGILAMAGSNRRFLTATALRMEIPVVNVTGVFPTPDEDASGWVFRCPGDDPRQQRRIIDYIADEREYSRWAILSTPGPTSQRHLTTWRNMLGFDGAGTATVVVDLPCAPNGGGLDKTLELVQRSGAQVVLTWADAAESARILRTMRQRGMTQLFVGGERVVCKEFVQAVGTVPGEVIAIWPCPHRRDLKTLARFEKRYTEQNSPARRKRPPQDAAYRAYHAANHLFFAVNMAGPDHEAIRAALVKLSAAGVTTLKQGKWEPLIP